MKKIHFGKPSGFDYAILNERMKKTAHIGGVLYGADNGPLVVAHVGDMIMVDGIGMFYGCWQVGEEIAFAQSYKDVGYAEDHERYGSFSAGWDDPRRVEAEAMPVVLRVTERKAIRVKDMSDEEIIAMGMAKSETGVIESCGSSGSIFMPKELGGTERPAADAMKRMMDKVIAKKPGSYEKNPVVLLYRFEVIRSELC